MGSEKALQLAWLLGLLVLSAGIFVYFHTLSVLILILLAALAYRRPIYGVSVLFLVISVDTTEPVLARSLSPSRSSSWQLVSWVG